MEKSQIKRVIHELSDAEKARLADYREKISQEMPELEFRDQMRKDAREEATLSGELRRAIHANPCSLAEIAFQVGLSPLLLDDFLTGERTLRSDVLDRLASVLGYELHKVC
jgi:transcriptional regulator with XRE-family HTH domain